jgi:AraC-like DNA-binding protein
VTTTLAHSIENAYANRILSPTRFDPDIDVMIGLETRTIPREYIWDGLRRGGDKKHPNIIFQYTLDGWGLYSEGKTRQRVEPHMAFTAYIPSAHVYHLPPQSPSWRFFWFGLRHPYVVERMRKCMMQCGRVLKIEPESVLFARMRALFEGICHNSFRDAYDLEQAQLEMMLAYDRHTKENQYAPRLRDTLLNETRAIVLNRLSVPIGIEELAAQRKMSRTHFTHYFRAKTGIPPAQFVTEVRLREAETRLMRSDDKLATIASDCGFADANHLCKVFRRHYHISPGQFRKQLR